MNKIRIIDLLNKIANGEKVPKKFIIKGSCFKDLYFEYNEKYNCYDLIGENFKKGYYVFGYSELNDEIIIIEEEKKIPEKINTIGSKWYSDYIKSYVDEEDKYSCYDELLMNKINEIIDYLKSKGE